MKKILIGLLATSQLVIAQTKWSDLAVESTFAGGDWLMMLDATGPTNKRATFASLADWFLGTAGADNLLVSQGTITDPALGISTTVTWNDGADTFTAWQLDVTDTASAAGSLLLDLQVASTSEFAVGKDGVIDTVSVDSTSIQDNTVASGDILDDTVSTSDLAATLTFSDGDFLDLAAILHNDTALQGLRLPQIGAAPSNPVSGEGFIGWNETGNEVLVYNGSSWAAITGGGSGDITAVGPFTTGDAFVDGTASSGTTMLTWEGTTVDTNELTIVAPTADPGSDIVITLPSATGTLLTDLSGDTTPSLGGNLAVGSNEIQSSGDITLQLGDALGVNKFAIQDSGSNEVASIDSDGDFTVTNLFTDRADYNEQVSITNPAAGDGSIYLDSDDNTFKAIVADEGNTLQTLLTDQSAFAAFFTFTDEDVSPAVVGRLKYDNTITGLNDGSLVWYDGDEVRSLVDINGSDGAGTAIAAGDDGYVVKFNWNAGDGYFSLEPDSTGSGSLGTNLSSSTDDILSNNGTILLGGTGGTNNETLDFDFETTANTVAITTATGVTDIDFGTLQIVDDASNVANDTIDSQHYAAGSVDGEHLSADARGQFSEVLTGAGPHNLSISATTGEGYGSIHYVDTASTVNIPAVQDGCSFTIVTIGAIAVTVDIDGADQLRLNGSPFDAVGDGATNSSTAGDTIVITYYSADGWHAISDGNWTAQ